MVILYPIRLHGPRLYYILLFVSLFARQASGEPHAVRGTLDLSHHDYTSTQSVPLTGQWLFQWDALLDSASLVETDRYTTIPDNWDTYTGSWLWFPQQLGHCTYGLRVRLPQAGKIWALRLPLIRTAYNLYVNGQLIAKAGKVASGLTMQPAVNNKIVSFFVPGQEAFILLQVSNYYFSYGGLQDPLQLGNPQTLIQSQQKSLWLSACIIGILCIIGLYHFVLYGLRSQDKAPFYFGLLCIATAIRESFNAERIFYQLFPNLAWENAVRISFIAFPIGITSMALYLNSLFPDLIAKPIKRSILAFHLGLLLLILITPALTYSAWATLMIPVAVVQCGYFVWVAGKATWQHREGAILILLGMFILFLGVVNDTLFHIHYVHSYYLLSAAIVAFTFCQAVVLAIRFSSAYARSEALTQELQTAHQTVAQMTWQQEEAERSRILEEMKSRFFSNITHEFRTPLTLILAPVEQVLQKINNSTEPDPFHLRHTLTTIHRNARQLLALINQLLDLSKLEAGSMPISESQGNVDSFVKELVDSFESAAQAKGVALLYQSGLSDGELFFDADKLGKIVRNLLANALRHTPPGGTVQVQLASSAAFSSTSLQLVVSDTGTGISKEHLPFIFDRFYQIADPSAQTVGGSGIGLALVKELVDLLQGEIRVKSQLGQGTTFTLDWPMKTLNESVKQVQPYFADVSDNTFILEPVQPVEYAPETNAPLILVVEDNPDLRAFITGALITSYRVITAPNGLEGWKLCQQELPELVISDVMMPSMDGYSLCRLIKQTRVTSHIAVMLLTAKAAAESRIEGLSSGANDYLTKPFQLNELQIRVDNLIQYQQQLRQFFQHQFVQPETHAPSAPTEDPFLNVLYALLDQHLDDVNLSVGTLATQVAMSARTLNRKLSTLTGMTAKEFIRNYRLVKATGLLKAGHSISETAYMVGFESPSYFGQCFKELYAVSPSDYVRTTDLSGN